jgi:hypothetical protein
VILPVPIRRLKKAMDRFIHCSHRLKIVFLS